MTRIPTLTAVAASLLLAIPAAAQEQTPPATAPHAGHNMAAMENCCCNDEAHHQQMAARLTAEAEAQEARAARHEAMARMSPGNPNRNAGLTTRVHCERAAQQARANAAALREMAAAHAAR